MRIIRADEREARDLGWLQSRFHFSFDDYHDPTNVHFGPLRVFNDDTIQPNGGFPMHPHRDMEIISVILDGHIAHRDSAGNSATLGPGEVQVMTAGSGIHHSEFNASDSEALRLLQIWIFPRTKGLTPRHVERKWDLDSLKGGLVPLVSDGGIPGTLTIDQDATLLRGRLAKGQQVAHPTEAGRRQYLFVIEGDLEVNGERLSTGDQARITEAEGLDLIAHSAADVLLIDLP